MWDVVLDAFIDSLKILPFLLIFYLIIEIVEEKVSTNERFFKYTNSKFAPLIGASLGIIPQCGFSVVASELFSKKYITIGTLFAIFIATSDEAIPIILSNPSKSYLIFPIILLKFCFALIIGYGLDLILKKHNKNLVFKDVKSEKTKEDCNKIAKETNHIDENKQEETIENALTDLQQEEIKDNINIHNGCCGHHIERKRNPFETIFLHPLIHSAKIFLYILLINLSLGLIIYYVGEQNFVNFMKSVIWIQPILVALVGLIPNCAASVLITQLLLINGINFGSAFAGLCCNAGLGLTILFKENKNIKSNIYITIGLFAISVLLGYVIMGVMMLF